MNKTLNSGHVNKRILIAKLGLDGHDKGAKIIINFLNPHDTRYGKQN